MSQSPLRLAQITPSADAPLQAAHCILQVRGAGDGDRETAGQRFGLNVKRCSCSANS